MSVVPTGAIRDEGTSYHYAPPSREIGPTPAALRSIEETLARRGLPYVGGLTWTTDAPYRETRGKVERRVAEGCITVEMEAAALYTFVRVAGAKVLCIAHVTNTMGQSNEDSKKARRTAPQRRSRC